VDNRPALYIARSFVPDLRMHIKRVLRLKGREIGCVLEG
jgi:hypothetical protein